MGVITGMDPHKRPATIEVIDEQARMLAAGKYGTDKACNGTGRHLADRLVHDGETVSGVPPKLSAQVRVPAAGNGRKTGEVDARSVALAALRAPGLVQVRVEEDLVVMGMLAGRRDELGRARTQVTDRLLLELLPGGAEKYLPARQARALPATVKPRDLAGKTRRRLAAGLISQPGATGKKTRALDKELAGLVTARGSTLMDLHGTGPPGAARLLADAGGIHRSASRDRFASRNGTAPWMPPRAARPGTGSPAPGTGAPTGSCTSWPWSSCGTRPGAAPASTPAGPAACPR